MQSHKACRKVVAAAHIWACASAAGSAVCSSTAVYAAQGCAELLAQLSIMRAEASCKRSGEMPTDEEETLLDAPPSKQQPLPLVARISIFMALWYACSGFTLFGNKYILSTLHADPNLLAMSQMTFTASFGAFKMYGPHLLGCGPPQPSPLHTQRWRNFMLDMLIVGTMRVLTVVLGLVSLKYVAVSFTETVKSSAPFFTVIFARLMLNERTSFMVNLSLVPVVSGLALCSATELSFNMVGFLAAVINNCIDCVQNVFSKKLLSTHYNYVNLQFYTSAAALAVQMPYMLYSRYSEGADTSSSFSTALACALLLNGVFFHLQSVLAYAVMGLISPVTQSVANTLKRALLIWFSVLYFGNPLTFMSAFGTALCIAGVFAYNHARMHYPYVSPREVAPGK